MKELPKLSNVAVGNEPEPKAEKNLRPGWFCFPCRLSCYYVASLLKGAAFPSQKLPRGGISLLRF